jgi:hypothetical protein
METWNMTAHLRLEEDQNTFVVAEPSPRFVAREDQKAGKSTRELHVYRLPTYWFRQRVSNCDPL